MPKKVEDVIRERGYYMTKTKGTSMYPLIKSDCSDVCIVKIDGEIQKYDVILYKRETGEHVLHRVLGKNDGGYICCGDNQWILEYNVTRDMVLGKLDSWYKRDKKYTVRDKRYLRYVKFWCKSLKLRKLMLKLMRFRYKPKEWCYRVYKKVFKKG